MRTLRYLMGKKKPLVNRNTGNIDLGYNYIPNNLNNNVAINSSMVINNLPNSPVGLTYGSLWRDGDGYVRIV